MAFPAGITLDLDFTAGLPAGNTFTLDLMTPGTLDPGITFTRASIGTYFDVNGIVQTAASGAARWDYDPVTHVIRGLLIEEQRTNTALWSGDFTQVTWGKASCTLAAGTAGPNGATTGSGIIINSGVVGYLTQVITPTVGTSYTMSVFAKAGTQVTSTLLMPGAWWADAINRAAVFNLSTGQMTQVAGGTAVGSIVPIGNGWYRISLTATPDTANNGSFQFMRAPVNGDGVSVFYYAWGGQIEIGAFPTSYIPTTTATVTRAADAATMPTSTWLTSPTAWTYAVEAMLPAAGGTPIYAQLDDATNNNRSSVASDAGLVNMRGFEASGGATTLNTLNAGSPTVGMPFQVAMSSAASAHQLALNGSLATLGTNASPPPIVTTLRLGKGNAATSGSFYLRRFRYWSRALSASEMQAVTTWQFARASIATDGFYTDAPGSAFNTYPANTPRFLNGGLYLEESHNNWLLNSGAPATQTVSLGSSGGVYCLWVIGTGSATVTAGTAVGTGFGSVATAGTPAFFTVSTSGTVVVTVAGSLTRFQLERGPAVTASTTFPTSYIPTTGAVVARAVDVCTVPSGGWYNPAASTFYVEAVDRVTPIGTSPVAMYAGTSRSGLIHRSTGTVSIVDTTAGFTTDLPGGAVADNVPYRAMGAFRNGRQAGARDGGAVFTNAAATISSGLTTLGIGGYNNGSLPMTGTVRRVRYWPTDLVDADLQMGSAGQAWVTAQVFAKGRARSLPPSLVSPIAARSVALGRGRDSAPRIFPIIAAGRSVGASRPAFLAGIPLTGRSVAIGAGNSAPGFVPVQINVRGRGGTTGRALPPLAPVAVLASGGAALRAAGVNVSGSNVGSRARATARLVGGQLALAALAARARSVVAGVAPQAALSALLAGGRAVARAGAAGAPICVVLALGRGRSKLRAGQSVPSLVTARGRGSVSVLALLPPPTSPLQARSGAVAQAGVTRLVLAMMAAGGRAQGHIRAGQRINQPIVALGQGSTQGLPVVFPLAALRARSALTSQGRFDAWVARSLLRARGGGVLVLYATVPARRVVRHVSLVGVVREPRLTGTKQQVDLQGVL
jgi:hypothetical protein